MRSILKNAWLSFCAVAILTALPLLYLVSERLDPQGGSNSSCISEPLPPVSNGSGIIVSGHHTVCDNIVHDSAIYLYLHKAGGADTPSSLIFRYADDPSTALPKMEWKDNNSVLISVGDVVQVTKLVESFDGINIRYSIGREQIPREAWGLNVRHLEYLFALLVAVLVTAVVSGAFLIKSIIRDRRAR